MGASFSVAYNVFKAEGLPSEGSFFEKTETALSENMPFREELSGFMDTARYISGVRHFDNIYIGSEGSLLLDIEKPSSRAFSLTKNYITSFAERNQIKPYFMLIPTASAILQHEIDSFARLEIYSQRNLINSMYSEFDGAVRTTDIYQTLYDHRDEYIYYHTENIPTALGGFYIYGELCNRLGIEQKKLDSFSTAYVAHNFYGSLATDFFRPYSAPDFITFYEYTGEDFGIIMEHKNVNGTSRITEKLFYYNEKVFDDKTDMILGGISPVIEITSSENYGERSSILVFGDSSAKSWLPFLASNYGRITFVELGLASEELLSEIKVSKYDQVLFAYSTASFVEEIPLEKLEYVQ
ncbi:MAG: hypothetical protein IJO22_03985 [Oscillospiraceae bacterium]|nr:hypothetical protein [Oscillospiraceae bacterium]